MKGRLWIKVGSVEVNLLYKNNLIFILIQNLKLDKEEYRALSPPLSKLDMFHSPYFLLLLCHFSHLP